MAVTMELRGLAPAPEEEWHRLLRFVGWCEDDRRAAARSVEILFRRGPELVARTYDYLSQVPETASILGWEQRVDERHLEERRRFFTIWLARTLGMDTSTEFGLYLFNAGKLHAGHGPRRIHTPPAYVTGSIGLVLSSFSRSLAEDGLDGEVAARAMAAWSKYLPVHLHMMLLGYGVAREMDRGDFAVRCSVFGRLRPLLGKEQVQVALEGRSRVGDALTKLFNYYPQVRPEALDRVWTAEERTQDLWEEVVPVYVPRPGWRVLLNGRDTGYDGGFEASVGEGDEVAIFPPGR